MNAAAVALSFNVVIATANSERMALLLATVLLVSLERSFPAMRAFRLL
jgi:hypothetical protein